MGVSTPISAFSTYFSEAKYRLYYLETYLKFLLNIFPILFLFFKMLCTFLPGFQVEGAGSAKGINLVVKPLARWPLPFFIAGKSDLAYGIQMFVEYFSEFFVVFFCILWSLFPNFRIFFSEFSNQNEVWIGFLFFGPH